MKVSNNAEPIRYLYVIVVKSHQMASQLTKSCRRITRRRIARNRPRRRLHPCPRQPCQLCYFIAAIEWCLIDRGVFAKRIPFEFRNLPVQETDFSSLSTSEIGEWTINSILLLFL